MAKYPFLSDEWMTEAKKIREEFSGQGAPSAHTVRMNQIITDVPFGEGTMEAHMDTSSGEAFMAGKIKVAGDMTKLMAMQSGAPDPTAQSVAARIADITE